MRPAPGERADTVAGKTDTSARLDSLKRAAAVRDSLEKFKAGDTVRTNFAQAEAPRSLDIGAPYTWNREQLMTSGAMTLADLIERIPGASGFRTSWLLDHEAATYLGDFGRVRVYVDGVPFAPPDRDGHGVLDLTAIQLWAFEHATIERGAAELRIYLRSWRYDRTIPASRVDVFTGDQDANTFRGFFAQRFGSGFGVQAAGENLSVSNTRAGGDGARRAGLVRLGWASGRWSLDVTHRFADNNRNSQVRRIPFGPVAANDAAASLGYARVAWGDPEQGPWVQAIAATSAFAQQSATIAGTTTDTTRVFDRRNAIYTLVGGTQWAGWRVSAGLRWTSIQNVGSTTPLVRASYDRGWASLQAYAERSAEDASTHGDVSVRLLPRSWLAVAGSYGGLAVNSSDSLRRRIKGYAWRGEIGVRVAGELWLSGGVLSRDSAWVMPPTRYDTTFTAILAPAARGTFASLRGRLYSDIFADVVATQWEQAGTLRPHYQTRAEVYLQTRWLSRFPSGSFGLLTSLAHEYREPVAFQTGSGVLRSSGGRAVHARLEIRILSGTLSWQLRNLAGDIQDQIPGALLPRSVSVYGIRWDFRN